MTALQIDEPARQFDRQGAKKMESPPSRRFLTRASYAAAVVVGLTNVAGCGGGGDSPSPAPAPPPPAPSPVTPVSIASNSYANYKQIGLIPQLLPPGDNTTRAYGNFTGSGQLDMFRAVVTYNPQLPIAAATPSRFEFYSKQPDGTYVQNTSLLPTTTGCLHPRKAIVGDFNGDAQPDIFVACTGYDALPFPGERNKVLLSQSNGTYSLSDASIDVGFHHGATAADLNGDGTIDVIVVNNFDTERAFTLLNDGSGRFTREGASRLPASIRSGNYFSVELVDLNEDGRLDLLLGGHEWEGATTAAFINPGSNNFSMVPAITVPPIANEGVVLDFTVTGTASTRTLWVVRTSGGDGTFYQSRVVQRIAYPSLASSIVLNQRPAAWIPWVVPATVGGVNSIVSDNSTDGVVIPQ